MQARVTKLLETQKRLLNELFGIMVLARTFNLDRAHIKGPCLEHLSLVQVALFTKQSAHEVYTDPGTPKQLLWPSLSQLEAAWKDSLPVASSEAWCSIT